MAGMICWYYEKEGKTTAYRPDLWKFNDCDARQRSLREKIIFMMKLLVPSICGFSHAFFSWTVPFVAEEVGIELAQLIGELRSGTKYEEVKGFTYALEPWKWILYIDGLEHVRFSGGSYCNHGCFAVWATG
jgi:hypothetical protein